jgi:hypothetical protein
MVALLRGSARPATRASKAEFDALVPPASTESDLVLTEASKSGYECDLHLPEKDSSMWRLGVGILALLLVLAVDWALCSEAFARLCERLDRRWLRSELAAREVGESRFPTVS